MRIGILSDIHGNHEALDACLRALEGSVDALYCLGDIVGYGADPDLCVRTVRDRCAKAVIGNHDTAVLGRLELSWFNDAARQALVWTRKALGPEQLAYLESLPKLLRGEGFEATHGSLRDPVCEYIDDRESACATFERMSAPVCLVGHSHVAGAFLWRLPRNGSAPAADPGALDTGGPGSPRASDAGAAPRVAAAEQLRYVDLSDGGTVVFDTAHRYIVNVGSVGQPRDGNRNASCGILDLDAMAVQVLRVTYDLRAAQEKIRRAGLPTVLWKRLEEGR